MVFIDSGTIVADGPTGELLGPAGPEPVRRYIGNIAQR